MRAVVTVFLVALAHSAFGASLSKTEITPFAFENEIYEIFGCMRNFMGEYYSVVEIDEVHIDFDSILIGAARGYLKLINLRLTDPSLIGLSNLLGTVHLLPPAFTIQGTATAHDLAVETEYDGDMTENELHMWGTGTLNAHVLDININDIYGRYGLLANPPFTDVRGSLSTGNSIGFITGYVDEEETQRVTDIINNLDPWVQENAVRINGILGDYVKAFLNGEYTPSEPEDEEAPNFWDQMQEYCNLASRVIRI